MLDFMSVYQQKRGVQLHSPKVINSNILFRFQIKSDIKAARIEATKAYRQYVEEPKTSQRRERLELELE